MALSKTVASITPAGIVTWRIKDLSRPDDAYCAFLPPRDGKLTIQTLGVADSLGRVKNHAFQVTASAKVPIVRTQASMLDLLGTLGRVETAHAITLEDGEAYESALVTASPAAGFKWKMVSDPSLDSDWYLEIQADRKYNATQIATIWAESPVATGTPNASDTLYAMRAIAVTDIAPAGISLIEIGTSYASDMSFIRNGRFTAELLTTQDDLGRSHGYAIKCDYEAEFMEGSVGTAWVDLPSLAQTANETRITFANGSIFTGSTALGFSFSAEHGQDANDIQFIKVSGSGIVLTSAWAGLWT